MGLALTSVPFDSEPSTIGGIVVTAGLLGIWLKKKKAIS
ncbi:PEP-CTERM sorting domain-containing protein [Nostoc sp. DedSLP04]